MSIESQAVIIYGHRIPRNLWREKFEYCEKNCEFDANIPSDWEDYFIDMDCTSDNGETFFGKIIYCIDESSEPKEIHDLLVTYEEKGEINRAYMYLFSGTPFVFNLAKKYVGLRWF